MPLNGRPPLTTQQYVSPFFAVDSKRVPEDQEDAGKMSIKDMEKVLAFHTTENYSPTRNRYITYWKEQIANKIILGENNE